MAFLVGLSFLLGIHKTSRFFLRKEKATGSSSSSSNILRPVASPLLLLRFGMFFRWFRPGHLRLCICRLSRGGLRVLEIICVLFCWSIALKKRLYFRAFLPNVMHSLKLIPGVGFILSVPPLKWVLEGIAAKLFRIMPLSGCRLCLRSAKTSVVSASWIVTELGW